MAYSSITNPRNFMNTVLYTGNGGTQSITLDGLNNMQPDWVWMKERSETRGHNIQDSVRGATKYIDSRSNAAQATVSNTLTSFNSNGFSLGSYDDVNKSSQTYVAWNWKAGTSFTNDASSTGIGSMDSAGSVNEEAGFAIVSYTGNETASTLKHGLSTVPQMIIIKGLISARDWVVGQHTQGWTKSAYLNETNAFSNQTHFNNTAPTSSVFTIEGGSNSNVNTNNAAYISYIFSERQGYSKFGSYVGNGNANGAFIYTGFKPAFIMVKKANNTGGWQLRDNKRTTFNLLTNLMYANATSAEQTTDGIDFLSNGWKLRNSAGDNNASGDTYIYMAFAEEPFVASNFNTATAR